MGSPTSREAPPVRTELLAPAGDIECLRAALAAGADAVYFGLRRFSARARAANFPVEELPAVMAELHRAGARGYLAVNTLIFDEELASAAALVAAAAEAGVDALIVQDLGLARLARRMVPTLPLHASTQMTISAAGAVELARRELGISRFILPRELSLAEIASLSAATRAELEVFVHGALCISYGGQCLASFAMGGRSGNRGECAQPCRLPYARLGASSPRDAGAGYPLSPRDLAAWELLPDLVGLGVRALKIEGRLKGPHYVETATGFYRRALDAALSGADFRPSREELDRLAGSFSRGFSRGFLGGARGTDLVDGGHPGGRGVRVGTVRGHSPRGLLVELDKDVRPGDGLAFDAADGEADRQGGRVYRAATNAPGGAGKPLTEIRFAEGALNLSAVAVGAGVWRTSDAGPRRAPAAAPTGRVPVRASVSGREGQKLELRLRDAEGNEAAASWPGPLEIARRHPPTPEMLAGQIGRLGGTPFRLEGVEAADLGQVLVPKSVLNSLRRQAADRLLELREARARHRVENPRALEDLRSSAAAKDPDGGAGARLTILVRTREQIEAVLDCRAPAVGTTLEAIIADLADPQDWPAAAETIRAAGVRVGLATPRVTQPGEEDLLERLTAAGPDVVLVRSLAALEGLRAGSADLVGDASLNAANPLSLDLLLRLGLTRLTAAAEPALQPGGLPGPFDPASLEAVVWRHESMFHTRHCLFGGSGDCRACGRLCRTAGRLLLGDRRGELHPVLVDAAGRSTVFSARPVDRLKEVPRLLARGVRFFRAELVDEDSDATTEVVSRAALAGRRN